MRLSKYATLGVVLTCTTWLWGGSATSAQWDPALEPAPPPATVAPAPPPAPPDMVEAPPPTSFAAPKQGLTLGFTWALQIGVPIFLDVPRDIVRPGADITFFGGADFGYFVIGGATGVGWNPIDLNGVTVDINGTPVRLSGRSPLSRIFLTLPEFRVQVPNLNVVLPYISGAFDMNFWNFRETEVGCGFYYCSEFSVYRFTPGFTGRAGFGFQAKRGVYIDVGFRYSMSGKGNFFEQVRWWLTPYVGVIVRKRP
ncbi:MAG: hypothetical protein AAF500_10145 [Myxococcota bacterium]